MSIYVRYIAEAITNKWLPDISAMQVFINRIQNILYAVDEALQLLLTDSAVCVLIKINSLASTK